MGSIMFVGTASDVGKSVIAAGMCRILLQDGYRPAPFKAQNMSLNSYVTPDGLEIGRAQAVQAEAAGIPCHSDMNPVLLKPTGDTQSQLVLHGKPAGNQSAWDYFMGSDREALWGEVRGAYDRLASAHDPVVLEGAGSISEMNLWKRDIVNMRMALHARADVYLIADIDRGGVFGSVYGTLALLPPEEKELIRGVLVNKFRGDGRLFEGGGASWRKLDGGAGHRRAALFQRHPYRGRGLGGAGAAGGFPTAWGF
ncbi:cobyric acid synthase [Puia sp. P3]|uniref:cobyric acid synthase n=1 Tax=Puia sp. P3 TaxID=3423952 RepID=UPI003D664F80